jgi:hypothetical protein
VLSELPLKELYLYSSTCKGNFFNSGFSKLQKLNIYVGDDISKIPVWGSVTDATRYKAAEKVFKN